MFAEVRRYEWCKLLIYIIREHRYGYLCSPYGVRSPSRGGCMLVAPASMVASLYTYADYFLRKSCTWSFGTISSWKV